MTKAGVTDPEKPPSACAHPGRRHKPERTEKSMQKYVVTEEEMRSFAYRPAFRNMEGLSFCYEADPESIRSVLPPCLSYADPVVRGHIGRIRDAQTGGPLTELALYVNAGHAGTVQPYVLSTLVQGPGAENTMVVSGRIGAIPVKIADEIVCRRSGNRIYAKAVRHGETIFEAAAETGDGYNAPEAKDILRDTIDTEIREDQWGRKFRLVWGGDGEHDPLGVTHFADTRLCSVSTSCVKAGHEPAKICDVSMVSTPDDPYGVLKMVRPIGAAWERISSFGVLGTRVAACIDPEENMPYFMAGRFDRSMMACCVEGP